MYAALPSSIQYSSPWRDLYWGAMSDTHTKQYNTSATNGSWFDQEQREIVHSAYLQNQWSLHGTTVACTAYGTVVYRRSSRLYMLHSISSHIYISKKCHDFDVYFLGPSHPLVRFSRPITLLRFAHKRTVNIMKLYIERNNLQLELIWYSLLLRSDVFAHRTHSRMLRTQTTSAPFLTSLGRESMHG